MVPSLDKESVGFHLFTPHQVHIATMLGSWHSDCGWPASGHPGGSPEPQSLPTPPVSGLRRAPRPWQSPLATCLLLGQPLSCKKHVVSLDPHNINLPAQPPYPQATSLVSSCFHAHHRRAYSHRVSTFPHHTSHPKDSPRFALGQFSEV